MSDPKPQTEVYTGFMKDCNKTNLGNLDVFDKVINVKLYVADTDADGNSVVTDEYVIRSDYEVYYPDMLDNAVGGNTYNLLGNRSYIRKCQYKPNIKLQYKRVSDNVQVNVDLFISNFAMLDKSGKLLTNFGNLTNKLVKVELTMGYFGQFKSLLQKNTVETMTVADLFDFSKKFNSGNGITQMEITAEYVQVDKLPPDSVLHIHGWVGNLYSDKITDSDEAKADSYSSLLNKIDLSKEKNDILSGLFYQEITKKYVNTSALSKVELSAIKASLKATGSLTDVQADSYGIKVFLSNGAKQYSKEMVAKLPSNSKGETNYPEISIRSTKNAMQKINLLMNALGIQDICTVSIPETGNILIYMPSEAENPSDSVLAGTDLEALYGKNSRALYWNRNLPAIYSINYDALTTITCPFFFLLNPFETFYFKSRYATSGLVRYFSDTSKVGKSKFYALWQNVSFSTTEDVNECIIACVATD